MNKQDFEIRAMDYLCGEMSEGERRDFEAELKQLPKLQDELAELSASKDLLKQISLPESTEIESEENIGDRDQHVHKLTGSMSEERGMIRPIAAMAAIFLATILTFTFVQFEAGQSEHGFYVHFGERGPETLTAFDEQDLMFLLDQIREENRLLMAAMLEQNQQVQNAQLEEALNLLTDYYERQRQRDLLFITEGLIQLEENTQQRFQQTDKAFVDLLYALSNQ
jgi:hypothetical protein